jgi:hypothetical protein
MPRLSCTARGLITVSPQNPEEPVVPELTWQKSTYSAEAANCVETATTSAAIHTRESKIPTSHLTVTPSTWTDFLSYAAEALGGSWCNQDVLVTGDLTAPALIAEQIAPKPTCYPQYAD